MQRNSQNFELRKQNLIDNKENRIKTATLDALMPMLSVEMQAQLKRDAARGIPIDVLLAKGKVSQEASKVEKDEFKKLTTKSIGDDLRTKYLGKVNPDTLTNALKFLNDPKFQKSYFNRLNTLEGKRNVWDKLDRALLQEAQVPVYDVLNWGDNETDDYGNMFTWNGITVNELMKKQK